VPIDDKDYFSAEDLAKRYSVHKLTVHGWKRKGLLGQGVLLGPGTRRWSRAEVLAFEGSRPSADERNLTRARVSGARSVIVRRIVRSA
jgi:hypothetical protein